MGQFTGNILGLLSNADTTAVPADALINAIQLYDRRRLECKFCTTSVKALRAHRN
mgnify:CR=1 FL=1